MSQKISNPFKVLGVPDNAPLDVCKKAYKRLARESHPDLGGSAEEFCRINEAFNMIEAGFKLSFTASVAKKQVLRHVDLMNFALFSK